MRISRPKHDFLTQLIIDCDTYNLSEKEALQYINARYSKPISRRTYFNYKNALKRDNELGVHMWLDHQSKIGFIIHYQKLMNSLEKSFDDTSIQLLIESKKLQSDRDENKILKLKSEQRESAKVFMELALGNPIVFRIKQMFKEKDDYNRLLREKIKELEGHTESDGKYANCEYKLYHNQKKNSVTIDI